MTFTNTPPPQTSQIQQPGKPLLRRWWFWVIVTVSCVSLIGGLIFVVASIFGADDEFSSSSEKYDAFQSYVCKTYWDMEQKGLATSVATGVLADKAATAADKQQALKITLDAKFETESSVPKTIKPDGEHCSGWVYSKLVEQESAKHFGTFTKKQAKEAGLYG
ncbi:hypothetical protein BRL53_09140 [Corynebacterium ulcerans]|uniref:hypothetical protein n=1 Tax=Corynebacterium ulcerans TaxID=65058 RepID=UPI000C78B0C9|nr:hypothetical protein [Corynebacterium ulcerans]PLV98783.1 hypothetical protein BRL53_09140 [Corynebacterium ulcerans]